MKRTKLSDRLKDILSAIDERGSAELTKLTVLKKWFEVSSRLSSFGIFIADQASRQNAKTTKEAAELFHEARTLLADVDVFAPKIPRTAAQTFHARLGAFQNEHKATRWGPLRILRDHNLFLVESGFDIYLGHRNRPADGYRLAASYCENYDPRYGDNLNGPSRQRIQEIIQFIEIVEAREQH